MSRSQRKAAVVVGSGILIVVVGTLLIRRYQQHARRDEVGKRMALLLTGLKRYEHFHSKLLPDTVLSGDGAALYSWRLPVVAYFTGMDQDFWAFRDEAWTSQGNQPIREEYNSGYERSVFEVRDGHETIFMTVLGDDTAFERGQTARLATMPEDTIILVEVDDSNVHWMQPGDLELDALLAKGRTAAEAGLGSRRDGSVWIGFVDRDAWLLRDDVPLDVLAPFFTLAGAALRDREQDLMPYHIVIKKNLDGGNLRR